MLTSDTALGYLMLTDVTTCVAESFGCGPSDQTVFLNNFFFIFLFELNTSAIGFSFSEALN